MRQCPRCTYPLNVATQTETHAEIDHCSRCGGSFILPGALAEKFESFADPEAWKQNEVGTFLGESKLLSPIDHRPMFAYLLSTSTTAIEVDYCGTSGGMWLDADEGKKLLKIKQEAAADTDGDSKSEPLSNALSYLFQILTGFPVEEYNPVHRKPVATFSMIGILVASFAAQIFFVSQGTSPSVIFKQFGAIPYNLMNGSNGLGLLTYAFFHGGFLHIIANLYFLYVFGDNIEDTLGIRKFLAIFFITSIAGGVLHTATFPQSAVPLVGASGAISGLMGAYLVLFPNVKVYMIVFKIIRLKVDMVWYLLFWLGMQMIMVMLGGKTNVGWMCHIGGFVAGVLLALLLRKTGSVAPSFEKEPGASEPG